MSKYYIEKFLKEVKDRELSLSTKVINELEQKGEKIFKSLYEKGFFIHDSGTYAMLFIAGGGPVYFDSYFQTKSALKMVLSFIKNEDSYFDIPDSELVDMTNYLSHVGKELSDSYKLFRDFFERSLEVQEHVLCVIKNTEKMYSENEVRKVMLTFSDSIDEQIDYLSSLLRDFKVDEDLTLFYGMGKAFMESDLEKMLAEKSAEKAVASLKWQMQQNFDESHLHLHIFRENGFRLFDYLMNNHLSSGIGWQSDVSFFYRMMEKREKLIHGSQKLFKEFLAKEYDLPEPMGKFKLWNDINTEKRNQIYSSAMRSIGLK
jgi:hypothetical protein